MTPPDWLLTLPVAAPLACAVLVLLLPATWTHRAGPVGALLSAAAVWPCLDWLLQVGPIQQSPGGWDAPLGIRLSLDGPSCLFLIFGAVMGLGISLYASAYFPPPADPAARSRPHLFWPLWFVAWGGVQSLFLTLDLFNIYVTLELVSIAGVGLILVDGGKGATRAALQYQLQTLVAGLVYLLGVGLMYNATGTLDLHIMGEQLQPSPLILAGMALMTTGLMVKSALFPLHFWLPRAHADAPAPVSAALSGLVVTAAFVIMARIWFAGLRVLVPEAFHVAIGALGTAGILWGGIQALRQHRLKRILAYSTVSQVGYLFLLFALDIRNTPEAGRLWAGAVFLALSHGLSKAGAFMAVGVLGQSEGSDHLSALRGAAHRRPAAVLVLALASVNLMGLPPSMGFVGKWWMLKTALQNGQGYWVVALLAGALLSGAYLFRVFETLLRPGEPSTSPPPKRPARAIRCMLAPAMALALISLLPVLFLNATDRLMSIVP